MEYGKYTPGDLQTEADTEVREGEGSDARSRPAGRSPGGLGTPQMAGPKICISNKSPGDADAAPWETHFANHWVAVKQNPYCVME